MIKTSIFLRFVPKLALAIPILAALSFLTFPSASQALTFNITSDHCTGGCGTAPFGTVILTQNGTSVDFVVDILNNVFVKTGSADFQYFKFNATGVVATDIGNFSNAQLGGAAGAFNGDGTGNFGFGVTCTLCGNGLGGAIPLSSLSFSVINSVIADFLTLNNLGNLFVADIYSSQTGNTGPVDVSTPAVPLPGAVWLFGTGVLGLGALGRMRKRKVNFA